MTAKGESAAWEIGWVGVSVEDAPAPFGSEDFPPDVDRSPE